MTTASPTRETFVQRDASDPLAPFRDQFDLPPGIVYLDGNSLGALPKATVERLDRAVRDEWGHDLIRSWNGHDWIGMPTRVGDKIARLVGADAGEVVVADSTSVNLFKVLAGALKLRPGRKTILTEEGNFPTDAYIAQGLIELLDDGHRLERAPGDGLEAAMGEDTAVVMVTHVDYRSGRMHDLPRLTRTARAKGAMMLWDLSHSVGAVPVDLNAAGADLAVGCGYKYLNGGPGAPAFLFVAARHQDAVRQPLSGWMGHDAPFAFEDGYRPAAGIGRHLAGTPPILSMSALEAGVDLFLEADMGRVRAKSVALTRGFIDLVRWKCAGAGFRLSSPEDPDARGSQVCLRHPNGHAIVQALIARGVIGDFRAPDILRFGFAPLYLRHVDVWDAVEVLRDVMVSRAWDRPEFHARAVVT